MDLFTFLFILSKWTWQRGEKKIEIKEDHAVIRVSQWIYSSSPIDPRSSHGREAKIQEMACSN